MKTKYFLILGLSFLFATPQVTLISRADAKEEMTQHWNQKMQSLLKIFADLLTDTSSEKRFNQKENQKRIQSNINKINTLAHDLKGIKSSNPDPSLGLMTQLFAEEAARAKEALQLGRTSYARSIIQSLPGYCIECHTSTQAGPQFSELPIKPTTPLYGVEKGEFLAATRQFDRAIDEFKQVILDSTLAKTKPLDWNRAVYYSLAISVRVKKDADLALGIVQSVLDQKNSPYYMVQDAQAWKKSILEWKKEPQQTLNSEEGYRQEMLRLSSAAHETQKFAMDRSADILYLRASAAAHDLLQKYPQGTKSNEAFLFAGLSYEVLKPAKVDDLHEFYYQACIQRTPHTATAELCYRRLESSIYLGYTGSSGTSIPTPILEKLAQFKKLAEPLQVIQSPTL
jgi:hypothetical protein